MRLAGFGIGAIADFDEELVRMEVEVFAVCTELVGGDGRDSAGGHGHGGGREEGFCDESHFAGVLTCSFVLGKERKI